MRLALIGYGKMGKMVERLALERGHTIVSILDKKVPINKDTLANPDICIDFTAPEVALETIRKIAACRVNLVMGTTGWYDQIETAKQIVGDSGIGFLYAPNFSLGVALFLKIVSEAAEVMKRTDRYAIAGVEQHHREKRDAPSGTAKEICSRIGADVPFTSVRCGSIPGTHSLIFDSPVDTITLTHQARSREGFAEGAITAAEWLQGKEGFYTLDALLA